VAADREKFDHRGLIRGQAGGVNDRPFGHREKLAQTAVSMDPEYADVDAGIRLAFTASDADAARQLRIYGDHLADLKSGA
jgi:hypothetical protein